MQQRKESHQKLGRRGKEAELLFARDRMAPVIDKASGGWRGSRGADHGEIPLCWLTGTQLQLRNSSGDTSDVFSLPMGLRC